MYSHSRIRWSWFALDLIVLVIFAGLAACNGGSNNRIIIVPTHTVSVTPTPAPSVTPTPASSATQTAIVTPTAGPTVSATPTATASPSPTPTAPPLVSNTNAFAIDPSRQLAYVPLIADNDPITGNCRVSVINVAADPNVTNPNVRTVVFSHDDLETSATIDTDDNLVIVTSGGNGNGGRVDIIDEKNNTVVAGSPFALPPGADVVDLSGASVGQALYDPVHKLVIISTIDDQIQGNCPKVGQCTGLLTFNPLTHVFSPIIEASATESFALDTNRDLVFDSSSFDPKGTATVVDMAKSKVCTLSDSNLDAAKGGVAVDQTNQVAVLGNFSGDLTLVNLFGSTLDETRSPCTLTEGGTPPNSLTSPVVTTPLTGVAVNPVTHDAFWLENSDDLMFLVSLPTSPVTQIKNSDLRKVVLSFVPDNPFGFVWQTEGLPNSVAVDFVHNMAYAIDDFANFLVRIDLAKFKANPNKIVTPLPAGTCKDLNSSFGCDNGFGIVYFPLPPAFSQ